MKQKLGIPFICKHKAFFPLCSDRFKDQNMLISLPIENKTKNRTWINL